MAEERATLKPLDGGRDQAYFTDRFWDPDKFDKRIEGYIQDRILNPFNRLFWVKYFHFTWILKGRVYHLKSEHIDEYVTLKKISCAYYNNYRHALVFTKLNNFEVMKACSKANKQ